MKKPGITIRKTVGIILMAAVVLADFLMLDVFASPLDKALICPGIDQDALENAREKGLRTAEEIEAEGIVLLENNGTLPFLEETERSICWDSVLIIRFMEERDREEVPTRIIVYLWSKRWRQRGWKSIRTEGML